MSKRSPSGDPEVKAEAAAKAEPAAARVGAAAKAVVIAAVASEALGAAGSLGEGASEHRQILRHQARRGHDAHRSTRASWLHLPPADSDRSSSQDRYSHRVCQRELAEHSAEDDGDADYASSRTGCVHGPGYRSRQFDVVIGKLESPLAAQLRHGPQPGRP